MTGLPGLSATQQAVICRPYLSTDLAAVRKLMCDTAIMGSPIDSQCADRELIADYFTQYYCRHIPDWIWVLEHRGRLVGYLMGCPDTRMFQQQTARDYPAILLRVLRRGSFFRPGSAGFLWRTIGDILGKVVRGEALDYFDPQYPAHAHLNVLPEGRSGTSLLV